MKHLILDAGPIINFGMNGILPVLRDLKKEFNGKFIITQTVKKEAIDHPKKIKRFELEALQVEELFKDKIIELPELTKEQEKKFKKITNNLMNLANSMFRAKGKNLHLIDKGEAEVLALAKIMNQNCTIAIDERTTRMLCENPENLRKLLEKKMHTKVRFNKKNKVFFENFKIIRSTELVYIANKKNLIKIKSPKAYEAMLYAVKYKGTSISEEEIRQMVRL